MNTVIVTRRAYADAPHKVIAGDRRNVEAQIEKHYPGAVIDARGGFDTPDGGSFLYDVCTVDE